MFVSNGAGLEARIAANVGPGEDGRLPDAGTMLTGLDIISLSSVHVRAAETERGEGKGSSAGSQQFLWCEQRVQVSSEIA